MKDKNDLSQQEQMALIRKEKAQRFSQQKAKNEAKELLTHLFLLQSLFQNYEFPKDRNVDIYASNEGADKYVAAVIELQHEIDALMEQWLGIESDLKELAHAMEVLSTGQSSDEGNSLTHDLTQFFQYVVLLHERLNYVLSHMNDRDEERRYYDKNIIVEVRLLQELLQRMMTQLSKKQMDDEEVTTPSITPVQTNAIDADVDDEDINQSNPLWTLPDEMMMYILSQVSAHDLLNARLMAKSKTAVVDAALELITRPHFIIDYLSHADGITGHQFTAFYQRTARYQELKRKVLANEPLTAEEAICYTLTRDCSVLPANLKTVMKEIELDKRTREHLELILTSSKEVYTINNKMEEMIGQGYSLEYLESKMKNDIYHLLARLKQHHPHQFANLLAGVNLSGLNFAGEDFSHLNLSGVKFSNADLRGATFRGACLRGVDFNGAILKDAEFTDAELRGAQLNRTNLEGVDLSTIDLAGIDFEWAFIRNVRLLPKEGVNCPPEQLHAILSHFEKSIAKHSSGSKRKLEERILKEIADQIEASTEYSLKEKIALLDVALSVIKPDLVVGIFPFQNACQELKEKITGAQPKQIIPDHPLKEEAQEIIKRILGIFNGSDQAAGGKTKNQTMPMPINEAAYRREYGLLRNCIAKYPELNDSIKVANALGISFEMWHLLYITCPAHLILPTKLPPILVDYPHETQETSEEKKHYASEVFDGSMFNLRKLQKIRLSDLDQYLYGEEDFVIFEGNGRTEVRVKLGDLFITFCPGGKGSVFANIEVIDFAKRERKPAFPVDLGRYGSIPFEAFVPLDPFVNYGPATVATGHFSVDDIKKTQEAYALKTQIIERVFASEKINRNRKKDLFFPIFEQYEQKQSHLAILPEELFQIVCADVHANTFKQHKTTSPLAEVRGLHGLFFKEKSNPVQVETNSQRVASSTSEKGKEKEVSNKENQPPQSKKIDSSIVYGLLSALQKEVVQKPTGPAAPAKSESNVPNQVPRKQIVPPATTRTVAPHVPQTVSTTVPSQGPRTFAAKQNGQQVVTQATTRTVTSHVPQTVSTTVPSQGPRTFAAKQNGQQV
ncbi:pentapeptide repeat-containing protein, partial [Legionella steigerwaltii]